MLRLARIAQHLVVCLVRGGTEHDETHGVSGGFTSGGIVLEESRFELFVDVYVSVIASSHDIDLIHLACSEFLPHDFERPLHPFVWRKAFVITHPHQP